MSGKDLLFGLFLQDDLATEGRIGEASLYLFPDVARVSAYEGLEAILVAKLGTRMAYKVEYGEMVLAFVQTEASAKLLEEDRGTLGGPGRGWCSISGTSTPSLKHSTTKR